MPIDSRPFELDSDYTDERNENVSIITVIANGELPPPREIQTYIEQSDLVFAVDGGANHCLELGIEPTHLVGDMDSISKEAKDKFSRTAKIFEADRDKDEMDLELALQKAVGSGASRILLFSWSSPDASYTYGNLLIASQCPVPIILINQRGWNTFLNEDCGGVEVHAADGTKKVSVFPFSQSVSLKTLGFKWELDWKKVSPQTVSQSNVLRDEVGSIALSKGVAWVAVEREFS